MENLERCQHGVAGEQNAGEVVNTPSVLKSNSHPSNWGKVIHCGFVSSYPGLQLQQQFACAHHKAHGQTQRRNWQTLSNGGYPLGNCIAPKYCNVPNQGNSNLRVSYIITTQEVMGPGQHFAKNVTMHPGVADIQSRVKLPAIKASYGCDNNGFNNDGNPIDIWHVLAIISTTMDTHLTQLITNLIKVLLFLKGA